MVKKIILPIIGAPSSGKGTRIKCAQTKGYKVISTSDLIKKAGIDTAKGNLINDDVVEKLMKNAIDEAEGRIILDGFPRTKRQAEFLISLGYPIMRVINIFLDEESVKQRSQDRLICPKCNATYTKSDFNPAKVPGICDVCGCKLVTREDENKIVKRYELYSKNLEGIIETFRKNNVEIVSLDANLAPDAILAFV